MEMLLCFLIVPVTHPVSLHVCVCVVWHHSNLTGVGTRDSPGTMATPYHFCC